MEQNQQQEPPVMGNNASNWEVVERYLNSFPPGYRFHPTDDELIVHYLKKREDGLPLPPSPIRYVYLYQSNPRELTRRYKAKREDAWYFLTPRNRKYPKGSRPDRAADGGYWKPTGVDKEIKSNNETVGYMKSLDFYEGKHPVGIRTDWKMHEYRIEQSAPPPANTSNEVNMKLDGWALCKIYLKSTVQTRKRTNEESNTHKAAPPTNAVKGVSPITTNLHQGPYTAYETSLANQGFHDHVVVNNRIIGSNNVHQNFFSTVSQVGEPSLSNLAYPVCNSKSHMAPFVGGYGTGLNPFTSHDVAAAAGPSNSSIHEQQYPSLYDSDLTAFMRECGKGLNPSTSHDVAAAEPSNSSTYDEQDPGFYDSGLMAFVREGYGKGMEPPASHGVAAEEGPSSSMHFNEEYDHSEPTLDKANSDDIFKSLEPLDQNMGFSSYDYDEHQPNMVTRKQ